MIVLCHRRAIWLSTAEHSPRNTCKLICQTGSDHIAVRPLLNLGQPRPKSVRAAINVLDYRSSSMDQQASQVTIATLADPQQLCSTAR